MSILTEIGEEYGSDDLNYDTFLAELTARLGHPSSPDGRETLFKLIDKLDRGKIGFDDLKGLAKEIGYSITDDEINDILDTISKGEDITYDDFERHMSRRYK